MKQDIKQEISVVYKNMRALDNLITDLQGIFLMSDDTMINNNKLCLRVGEIVDKFKEEIK